MKPQRNRAHRLIPRSLTSHIIILVLASLAVSHLVSFAILSDERRQALRYAARDQAVDQLAAVVQLLEQTPRDLHDGVLRAASTPRLWFRLVDRTELADSEEYGHTLRAREFLTERLGMPPDAVRVSFRFSWQPWYDRHHHDHDDDDDDETGDRDDDGHHDRYSKTGTMAGMTAAIRLSDGRWLESVTVFPGRDRPWAGPAMISLGLSALGVVLIVTILVRRAMRPVKRLSEAAERTGRGEHIDPVEETGPEDIRLLIRSFNTMRERLNRYIRDRMTMLAAMSHDLRTPITTLRLRAELLEDGDDKTSILATLDELQKMAEEVLSFIRAESRQEDARQVDIAALVDSAAEDVRAATGGTVDFDAAGIGDIVVACRAVALKRAVRNIIENAVRYGARADITVATEAGYVVITVCDSGPGIPEEDMGRLFEPFVRLESSRSRDTGGVGLGLAIARSIVLAHGGEIGLKNRPAGGLAVTIRIPAGSNPDQSL
ncbi:MAG: ATP-binding protein [Alphaproteobacteria bacterium]